MARTKSIVRYLAKQSNKVAIRHIVERVSAIMDKHPRITCFRLGNNSAEFDTDTDLCVDYSYLVPVKSLISEYEQYIPGFYWNVVVMQRFPDGKIRRTR